MSRLKVTLTGTGTSQGVPMIACKCEVCASSDPRDKRLRTAAVISKGRTTIAIDAGPDFRQQMLQNRINSLDAIVFTHEHKDHLAGLDDVRAYNYHQNQAMPLFASMRVQEAIRREFAYVFENSKYPGIPHVQLHEIHPFSQFKIGEIDLLPLEVKHMFMPVMGFRIEKFAYITDANFISEEVIEKLKGIEILVLNALRKEKHPSHFTLDEAMLMAQKIAAKKTYFIHLSHQMGKHEDVSRELPDGFFLGYDGLTLSL
ncbi:MAG: MBL fold metallo-hydrolase [Bacteroidota bacterium]